MPPDESKPSAAPPTPVPRRGLTLMAFILVAMALLSIFANYEKRRVDQIEKISIVVSPPSPTPVISPSPGEY